MPPDFSTLKADGSWSFSHLTRKQTQYITHGYHTYPAKFIPQVVSRLIADLTSEGDTVVDPFMGSGTTIVESLVSRRHAVGVDINPVAHLVAKVKTTPLEPAFLKQEYSKLQAELEAQINGKLTLFTSQPRKILPRNERIDYWFPGKQKEQLGSILGTLFYIDHEDVRRFFLATFSQILKSCSIWLQRSVKPTRDFSKTPAEPLTAFLRHARYMLAHNQDFWNVLSPQVRECTSDYRIVECADARTLPLTDSRAHLIVTSPPYVTSYEYADLHQLTALWFEYADSLPEFRKQFIGSASSERTHIGLKSEKAEEICQDLGGGKKAREVRNYFADMLECFQEMKRVLKIGGKACIVIGNTELQGVEIRNAEVFAEQMQNIGFRIHNVIKREIPSKILPQTRDSKTGKFTSASDQNKVLAYPAEYILLMEKAS